MTSAPKPVLRDAAYIDGRSVYVAGRRAVAEAHAVVAREVGARLRRRHEVVRGDGVRGVRQVDVVQRRAASHHRRRARARPPSRTSSSTPSASRARGTPMRRPSQRDASAPGTSNGGASTVVASRGSGPASTAQDVPGLAHGARHRADLVERRSVRDEPVARDAAVRRLDADDAAERRRLTNRAAGVGAERHRHRAGRDQRRRAAARAARRAGLRPRGCAPAPNAEFSLDDPIANSSQLVLATMTAPAASRRSTTVAS